MHGRFQEITYQAEESKQCVTEGASSVSASQAGNIVSGEGSGSVYFVDDARQMGKNGHASISSVKSAKESRQCVTEGASTVSASQAANIVSGEGSGSVYFVKDARQTGMNGHVGIGSVKSTGVSFSDPMKPESGKHHPLPNLPDDQENEIRHELRWLKAKCQGITDISRSKNYWESCINLEIW